MQPSHWMLMLAAPPSLRRARTLDRHFRWTQSTFQFARSSDAVEVNLTLLQLDPETPDERTRLG
eukprot:2987117-Amphidinium_carterae.1